MRTQSEGTYAAGVLTRGALRHGYIIASFWLFILAWERYVQSFLLIREGGLAVIASHNITIKERVGTNIICYSVCLVIVDANAQLFLLFSNVGSFNKYSEVMMWINDV